MRGEHRASAEFLAVAAAGAIPVIVDPDAPGVQKGMRAAACRVFNRS